MASSAAQYVSSFLGCLVCLGSGHAPRLSPRPSSHGACMPLKACRIHTHTHTQRSILSNKLISYADCFFISKLFSLPRPTQSLLLLLLLLPAASPALVSCCLLLVSRKKDTRRERKGGNCQQGQMIYEYELCSPRFFTPVWNPFLLLLFLGFGWRVSGAFSAVFVFVVGCNLPAKY